MREAFAEQLQELEHRILGGYEDAASTLATVAAAVEEPTGSRIEAIQAAGRTLRTGTHVIHADLVVIAARQAPVAQDLRLVMAMIELTHHGTLIANQLSLIAEQLNEIDPDVLDRADGAPALSDMCDVASALLRQAARAFQTRDLVLARGLDAADDELDALNRAIFERAALADLPEAQRARCLRHVLIARALERIGDNAVDIAEQAAFVLTADVTEFSDASRPRLPREQ